MTLGGGIAMDMALACPQRVKKLILLDSIGYPLKHNFFSWLLKLPVFMVAEASGCGKISAGSL